MAGALGAAVAASACCTVPLLLVSLGVGGAWVSTLTAFESYRPLFIALALGLLGLAFYRSQRASRLTDCDCDIETVPKSKSILMILGAFATIALVASPLVLGGPTDVAAANDILIVNSDDVRDVVLDIEGMTCAGCTTTVSKALLNTTGVIEATVTYEPSQAVIRYDKSRVTIDQLTRATRNAGYPSKVTNSEAAE
ncbi:MAG: mercuric transporter MerT family protein [Rhodothermales bacterium]